jgi:hypothetical protein
MALTQQDLNAFHGPQCEHAHHANTLFVVCVKHPGEGVAVMYEKNTGVLSVLCLECEVILAEIEVSKGVIN